MKRVEVGTGDVKSAANETLNKFIDEVTSNTAKEIKDVIDRAPAFTFTVTRDQKKRIDAWLKKQNTKGVKLQKKKIKNPGPEYLVCWEMGYPYTGAIGGEISYEFSPTSLGDVLVVKNSVTGDELNVTDYDCW